MTETQVEIRLSNPSRLYIGGEWVVPSSYRQLDVICPSTELRIAQVAEAGEADIDRAVAAARRAFDEGPWPQTDPLERADKLRAFAAHLRDRSVDIANAWTGQVGAVMSLTKHAGGRAAEALEFYADMASSFAWEEQRKPSYGDGVAYLVREPLGVVAAITPWNAPLEVMINKIAPALLAGCTVVMKPSPETPLEAYILAECAERAGFPEGVVNLVPADREVSDYLARHPGVDKVSFTGSTVAGRRIASVCGDRIARVTLELGGKSAAIIADDYELDKAISSLSRGICMMSGQVCAALSRTLVPRHLHDDFVAGFAAALDKIRVGDPYDAKSQMGPVAMSRQLARVKDYIARGREEGAQLVTGGDRPAWAERGYYISPTLFGNVDNSMKIAQEEIFGPVMCVIPYDNLDDAVRLANDSIYGLNGAIFTNDVKRAYSVARRVRTGNFAQNGLKFDFTLAFGGFKQSGIGREGGVDGLMPYVETKTIFLNTPHS